MVKALYTRNDAENIAALSMHFGLSPKVEDALASAGESMGGHIGFYDIAISASKALEETAKRSKIQWGQNADWIITIEQFSSEILGFMIAQGHAPSVGQMNKLAADSIYWEK